MSRDMNGDQEGRDVQVDEGETTRTEVEVTEADAVGKIDAADEIDESPSVVPVPPTNPVMAWCRSHVMTAVALGVLLASAVAAASVYWWVYRTDQMTGEAVQEQVVAAAREGTEALLSYSPEKLDADLANAKSHLTGDFLNYYTDFTDKVVGPASRDKGVKTEANVARAAVSQIRPGQADVLVFVNQVTTSKERPTPALSTSSVLVTLVNSGGHWLISAFNPI